MRQYQRMVFTRHHIYNNASTKTCTYACASTYATRRRNWLECVLCGWRVRCACVCVAVHIHIRSGGSGGERIHIYRNSFMICLQVRQQHVCPTYLACTDRDQDWMLVWSSCFFLSRHACVCVRVCVRVCVLVCVRLYVCMRVDDCACVHMCE